MRFQNLKVIITGFVLLLSLTTGTAWAQPSGKPILRASPESPVAFDLANYGGKTLLIFHWSTTCPVCLDKMEELRSNIAGWRNKPFVVLAVNHDKSRQDFQSYLQINKVIHGDNPQFIYIYNKDLIADSLYTGTGLPTSFLIDDKQALRQTYMGRIPAEAWNDIADLLP